MRITYIVAGAGDMYCGACARDVALIHELTARGHDVSVTALYTPFHADEESVLGTAPIYYGGINVFLQQVSSIFRSTPSVVDRLFDSPALLRWASKFAIKTKAEELGPMTISVLEGKNGQQKKELARLIAFLKQNPDRDVVNITNSMLSGIAVEIKSQLGVPVICTLQGEDGFVNMMPEPYKTRARDLMRKNAEFIDVFLSPSESYADKMSEFLAVDRDRIKVVRAGVNTSTYINPETRLKDPFTIGYLSVITPSKGLDLLVEAFIMLVKQHKRDVQLHVAGKVLNRDYFNSIHNRLDSEQLLSRFQHLGEVELAGKLAFLKECSVFAVPTRIEESRGMAAMEAMAMGLPVIVPECGVFPEMISLTSGGVLYPSQDAGMLAQSIADLIDNPSRTDELSKLGAAGIRRHYSASQMAEETLSVYSRLLQ